uniref:THAP-type domain-containing protein n=4 Tax=Clastoptera arizonana TaxID=38151 RepID=A0A1B6E0D3_9HEMI
MRTKISKDLKKNYPRQCAVFGCPVNAKCHPHVKLFDFPNRERIRYKKWVALANNPVLFAHQLKHPMICIGHFTSKQFTTPLKNELKPNAVPTMFNPHLNKCLIVRKENIHSKQGLNLSMLKKDRSDTINNNQISALFSKKEGKARIIINTTNRVSNFFDETNISVNLLSKLFSKPTEKSSELSFSRWIELAKKQNIICDQVAYALNTAKNLNNYTETLSDEDEHFSSDQHEDAQNITRDLNDSVTISSLFETGEDDELKHVQKNIKHIHNYTEVISSSDDSSIRNIDEDDILVKEQQNYGNSTVNQLSDCITVSSPSDSDEGTSSCFEEQNQMICDKEEHAQVIVKHSNNYMEVILSSDDNVNYIFEDDNKICDQQDDFIHKTLNKLNSCITNSSPMDCANVELLSYDNGLSILSEEYSDEEFRGFP